MHTLTQLTNHTKAVDLRRIWMGMREMEALIAVGCTGNRTRAACLWVAYMRVLGIVRCQYATRMGIMCQIWEYLHMSCTFNVSVDKKIKVVWIRH